MSDPLLDAIHEDILNAPDSTMPRVIGDFDDHLKASQELLNQ